MKPHQIQRLLPATRFRRQFRNLRPRAGATRGSGDRGRACFRGTRAGDHGHRAHRFRRALVGGELSSYPSLEQVGLEVNHCGQARVDRELPALGPRNDSTWVVGDAASPHESVGAPIHMSCKTAMPMARTRRTTSRGACPARPRSPFPWATPAPGSKRRRSRRDRDARAHSPSAPRLCTGDPSYTLLTTMPQTTEPSPMWLTRRSQEPEQASTRGAERFRNTFARATPPMRSLLAEQRPGPLIHGKTSSSSQGAAGVVRYVYGTTPSSRSSMGIRRLRVCSKKSNYRPILCASGSGLHAHECSNRDAGPAADVGGWSPKACVSSKTLRFRGLAAERFCSVWPPQGSISSTSCGLTARSATTPSRRSSRVSRPWVKSSPSATR
jgi:hypothetical protein